MYYQKSVLHHWKKNKKQFEDTVGIISLVCSLSAELLSSDRPLKENALKKGVRNSCVLIGFFLSSLAFTPLICGEESGAVLTDSSPMRSSCSSTARLVVYLHVQL